MGRLIAAFVRHGHYHQPEGVPSAHLAHPLTERGLAQAREAVDLLWSTARSERWSIHPVIDSSRMLRAWQTATVLAEGLGSLADNRFSVDEFSTLAERCVGAAANLTTDEIESMVRRDPRFDPLPEGWKSESTLRLPFQGAESLLEAGARVAEHVAARCAELAAASAGDLLKVFVGHGGAFRHAAVHMGVLDIGAVSGLSMHHCRPIFLERGSDGHFRHVLGEWKARKRDKPPAD
jgi:2,3-bisphosphoglycerate-dependent phosphoglycerate mutase